MHIKVIPITLCLFITPLQASEIHEAWEQNGNKFTLEANLPYNEEQIDTFMNICLDFHQTYLNSEDCKLYNPNGLKKKFEEKAVQTYESYKKEIEKGKGSLLLISKETEILGGCYYTNRVYGSYQTIYLSAFKQDLPQKELYQIHHKMIDIFSSLTYFPNHVSTIFQMEDTHFYMPLISQFACEKVPQDHKYLIVTTLFSNESNENPADLVDFPEDVVRTEIFGNYFESENLKKLAGVKTTPAQKKEDPESDCILL